MIKASELYTEIVDYYRKTDLNDLILGGLIDKDTVIVTGKRNSLSLDVQDALIQQDRAYRIYPSRKEIDDDPKASEKKDKDLEKVRRYLTDRFSYLMRFVFCLDLRKYRENGSYAVPAQDAPVIKEILLRSVSEHDFDLIIGKWLKGQIADNAYGEIVELSKRLFHLIRNINNVEPERKERWITALRIALRTDLAYTVTEAMFTIHDIFSKALPFVPHGGGFDPKSVYQAQIGESILNYLYDLGKQAQDESVKAVYQYLQSADFERITSPEAFPSVELMEMKSICEHLFGNKGLTELMPNADRVAAFTEYFISVDKSYLEKLTARKETDRKRYERKKDEGKD